MQDTKPLASYFDNPGLGKWAEHDGKTVFVPNFPKWLTPENKPAKQRFHEKGSGAWTPGEWGFSKDITQRIAVVKENQRIIDYYKSLGQVPPSDSTTHLPGTPWRISDIGYNQERFERSSLKKKAKADYIKKYVTTIQARRDRLSKLLIDNSTLYDKTNQGLILTLSNVGHDYNNLRDIVASAKDEYDLTGLTGKARHDRKNEMNSDIHARKTVLTAQTCEVFTRRMRQIKAAADAIGTRNFLGMDLPPVDENGECFYYLLMAWCGTARQQIMRILAFDYPEEDGPKREYAYQYGVTEDIMAQLKSMTSPVKLGSRYRRPTHEPYADAEQLHAWFVAHEPYAFFRASAPT